MIKRISVNRGIPGTHPGRRLLFLRCLRASLVCVAGVFGAATSCPAVNEVAPVKLENAAWEITLEPRWGGRASKMLAKKHSHDFILQWSVAKDGATAEGGLFEGHMSGSYVSEQINEACSVLQKSPHSVKLGWVNNHPLFEGLAEERVVSLTENNSAIDLSLQVTNTSLKDKTICYRFHDFLGTGLGRGLDSVYIVPHKKDRLSAHMVVDQDPHELHFITPAENWYAVVDLVRDLGLLVRVKGAPVKDFYFWNGGKIRTAEIFFPLEKLPGGKKWETKVSYTAFSPSSPDTGDKDLDWKLSENRIRDCLRDTGNSSLTTGLPLGAVLEIPHQVRPIVISPVHPFELTLGTDRLPAYGGNLVRIALHGTPGEVVPLAFAITAREHVSRGAVSFGKLQSGKSEIPQESFAPRYVSRGESKFLIHDWKLAQNAPNEIARINNSVRDADALTPFALKRGENAIVWTNLRVPPSARPGQYQGACVVETDGGEKSKVEIQLSVYPFALIKPADKAYSSFFRYRLKTGRDDKNPTSISRDVYLEALRSIDDLGYSGLVMEDVRGKEDILWVLDKCAELGWRNAPFVLIYPEGVTPAELETRYGKYGFKMLAWTFDEPARYRDIPGVIEAYQLRMRQGYQGVFTPSVPLALILADALEKIVPIINLDGNAAYVFDATRRYRASGRPVYWYGMPFGSPEICKRLQRGIYLWKEPVNGILDWGEDSIRTEPGASMTGFAGTKVISTVARENVRQGLIDLCYLTTLEKMAGTEKNGSARKDAEELMRWIKSTFTNDPWSEADLIGKPQYLDEIRREAARILENLAKP